MCFTSQISADDLKTTKTIMEVNDHPLFHKTKEEVRELELDGLDWNTFLCHIAPLCT